MKKNKLTEKLIVLRKDIFPKEEVRMKKFLKNVFFCLLSGFCGVNNDRVRRRFRKGRSGNK